MPRALLTGIDSCAFKILLTLGPADAAGGDGRAGAQTLMGVAGVLAHTPLAAHPTLMREPSLPPCALMMAISRTGVSADKLQLETNLKPETSSVT